jgi:hypothetical protein
MRRIVAIAALLAIPILARAQDEKPLPDIHALILDVERNETAAEKIRASYTYHVHDERQNQDSSGKVKDTSTTDSDSLTIDGVRVDRVTARDGKPLTPAEAAKESEKIDKEVAKAKERRAKLEGKGEVTDSRGDQILTASRILQLGQFSNPRRVDLNGRPTIVVDYAGDPHAKTNNRFESVFRDLVGTVWIDEQDRTLAQVEGHFLKDFKVGGGLVADIRKDSGFAGSWSKINGEVWLPVDFTGHGGIRILLVASFNGSIHLRMSDYRKFRSSSTIVGTNGIVGADTQPDTPPVPPVTPPPNQP